MNLGQHSAVLFDYNDNMREVDETSHRSSYPEAILPGAGLKGAGFCFSPCRLLTLEGTSLGARKPTRCRGA